MPFHAQQIKTARLHLQKSDPVMKRILKQVGPFSARANPDRFGTLVRSIVSQQISTSAARTIGQRLVEAVAGRAQRLPNGAGKLTAEHLQLLDVDEMRELGVSKQKAIYLLDLAAQVTAGELDLRTIGRKKDEEIIEALVQVKGIGRWTAQMFLIFSLARMDVLPVDDLGIKNAIQKHYGLDELPGRETIESVAQPWRPYATVACWYLWRSLEND